MKRDIIILIIVTVYSIILAESVKYETKTGKDSNDYSYEYVTNDPTATRISSTSRTGTSSTWSR